MMNKLIVGLLPGLMLQGQVWAASFDCAKASTKVEQMICGSEELEK